MAEQGPWLHLLRQKSCLLSQMKLHKMVVTHGQPHDLPGGYPGIFSHMALLLSLPEGRRSRFGNPGRSVLLGWHPVVVHLFDMQGAFTQVFVLGQLNGNELA